MTAVHDTLRQAIATEIGAWDDDKEWENYDDIAERVLAVFLADPVVQRAFAITHAVDNAREETTPSGRAPVIDGHRAFYGYEAIARLRTAGKTT